jgi:hypothetical protein
MLSENDLWNMLSREDQQVNGREWSQSFHMGLIGRREGCPETVRFRQ